MIVAGEASGDMHAARLVTEIQGLDPTVTFSGLGGPKMQESGVELYQDLTKIAVVGFWEVLKHYSSFKKAFQLILKKARQLNPAAIILVDYPGFNLRLAKAIKDSKKLKNTKIIYYISPQVWAWKKKRVHFIKKYVDEMLVIFQFEKEFYAKFGMDVHFPGHPLMDTLKVQTPKTQFLSQHHLQDYKITIGLLPGSRPKEVERILPVMLEAASLLRKEFPMIQFLLIKAPTIDQGIIDVTRSKHPTLLQLHIEEDNTTDVVNACDVCMVASGTATLETAILQKPMVVIYKTSWLTWILAKLFVKIPNIGLVNIVAGKRVVPECLQKQANPTTIANELKMIFTNELKIAEIKTELQKVKESLGEEGAIRRASEIVLKIL